ncbi:MAG: LysR family transcriptional regulator [Halopseudomonas aestusnigri]
MTNISLNGLRAFEVAARHLSFTKAAVELHITQAAISQQIRRLEEQLGVDLFLRKTRELSLTASGRELAGTTRAAINSIQNTIDQITDTNVQGVLTISTLASFASRWLIPRLSKFQEQHTDIELHVHTSGAKVNFMKSGIDAAIRLRAIKGTEKASNEPSQHSELLVPDALCLVATPALKKALGNNIHALYEQTLVVDGSRLGGSNTLDFTAQQTQKALTSLNLDRSQLNIVEYSQSDDVVLAALAGQGIALTRLSLCLEELETGRLQILFEYCNPLNFGYCLVFPDHMAKDVRFLAFKRWLHSETEIFNQRLKQYSHPFAPTQSEIN